MKALRALFVTVVLLAEVAPVCLGAEPTLNLRRTTVVEVVEKTKDAVVYISSTKLQAQRINPFGNNPMFQDFDFGTALVPANSLGSGFIVHSDGYIVTNNHVVDRARQITVQLLDGRKFDADVLSADALADLAIIKIKAEKPLPALELGDSSDLMVGEPVIAVGNPLGFSHSVSTGIVSALHRDLGTAQKPIFTDLIQTDAAINPGNSGGPLLNAYGQVIGINTAIRGDAQNIGFAIQVNKLRDLIPELMSPALVNKLEIPLRLKEKRAILPPASVVTTVVRESDGATIRTIDGKKPYDLVDAYATLLRQEQGKSFEVATEGHRPERIEPQAVALPEGLVAAKNRLGIVVEQITPRLSAQLKLPIESGIVITEVAQGSVADNIQLQPRDIIIWIGPAQINNMQDFLAAMQRLPKQGSVPIAIYRDGGQMRGALQL
ncbi:MAG TPA: trypsin-like peptidase domain-containing protein [Tepidisphaeraceae bacterium]|nr:trypsin-like peptidase domain-containing protein [Tepidisphaeraceae bacterium]